LGAAIKPSIKPSGVRARFHPNLALTPSPFPNLDLCWPCSSCPSPLRLPFPCPPHLRARRYVVCPQGSKLAVLTRLLRQDLELQGDDSAPARVMVFANNQQVGNGWG